MAKPRPMYRIYANTQSGAYLLEQITHWQKRAAEWRLRAARWSAEGEPAEVARCRASVLRCVTNMVQYRRALAVKIQQP